MLELGRADFWQDRREGEMIRIGDFDLAAMDHLLDAARVASRRLFAFDSDQSGTTERHATAKIVATMAAEAWRRTGVPEVSHRTVDGPLAKIVKTGVDAIIGKPVTL